MRILVTGSRDWVDADRVIDAIAALVAEAGPGPHVVVHGDCPTGADAFANQVSIPGVVVEAHPADWDSHGRAAGPSRNAYMVGLGADVCLAFISECTSPRCDLPGKHLSHGASGCADLAAAAGIDTRRHFV